MLHNVHRKMKIFRNYFDFQRHLRFGLIFISSCMFFLRPELLFSNTFFLRHAEIKTAIQSGDSSSLPSLSKNNPDAPILFVLQAREAYRNHEPRKAIQILEPVLLDLVFNGFILSNRTQISEGFEAGYIAYIGIPGGYSLWREFIYLTLAQSYYEIQLYPTALHYLAAIPAQSPFYSIAKSQTTWTQIQLKMFDEAAQELNTLFKVLEKNQNPLLLEEAKIQKAFLHLEKAQYNDAISTLATETKTQIAPSLTNLRAKILSQSLLVDYLQHASEYTFNAKFQRLTKVIQEIEKVQPAFRDPEFSFLAGETHWHLASILRVEDPNRYAENIRQSLSKANSWLSPWVDKSIQANTAHLSEDALFLSVAVLWEQNKRNEAIQRLQAHPRLFPQGEFRQDGYQLLADHYFEAADFPQALKYYAKLTEVGNEEKATYGIYKAAWAFYNIQQKWKALRHLERLVLHFQKEIAEDKSFEEGSLVKEAQQDMLLIMAEQLKAPQALEELAIFNYSPERFQEMKMKIAKNYRDIGRYEDSATLLKSLLRSTPPSPQASEWLAELIKTLLVYDIGEPMAKALDEFVPKLRPETINSQELHKEVGSILLTLHRDARKSDDPKLWKGTDLLYQAYLKHFPSSAEAEVWYYGGQRKEQLGHKWAAIDWYQKAGNLKSYTNAQDAGLSTLRVIKEILGDANYKKDSKSYIRMASACEWYIRQFPQSKEKTLAEFQYLELLFFAEQYTQARTYLKEIFQQEGYAKDHHDFYLNLNRKLYDQKRWEDAYTLSGEILETLKESATNQTSVQSFKKILLNIRQETAFENAFQSEKFLAEKSLSDPARAEKSANIRLWYERAIQESASPQIRIKAWHNLLISYPPKKEIGNFPEVLARFETMETTPQQIAMFMKDPAQAELVSAIYLHSARVWEKQALPLKQAEALSKAAQFEKKSSKAEGYRWDAVLKFGIYGELRPMKLEWHALAKNQSALLKDPKNIHLLARLLFWNGDYKGAWDTIRGVLNSNTPPSYAWLLLIDISLALQNNAQETLKPLEKEVQDFLWKSQAIQKNNTILFGIYHLLNLQKISANQHTKGMSPAVNYKNYPKTGFRWNPQQYPLPPGASPSDPPQAQLKARLDQVASTLKALSAQTQPLAAWMSSSNYQASTRGICGSAWIKSEGINRLNSLKNPAIASPQWKDFLKKLDVKIAEVNAEFGNEQKICAQQNQLAAYLLPDDETLSPLCNKKICFPLAPPSSEAILKIEQKFLTQNSSLNRTAQILELLEIGAWASAEQLAYSAPQASEKNFLLGLIRLAIGDAWNAATIFKELRNDAAQGYRARLILARIAWRFGHPEIAKAELQSIPTKVVFSAWENELKEGISFEKE